MKEKKKYIIIQLVLDIYIYIYIVPAGLTLPSNLLFQSTEYWNYRHVPWCPVKGFKKKKKDKFVTRHSHAHLSFPHLIGSLKQRIINFMSAST